MEPSIFTIGHSNLVIGQFIGLLQEHSIEVLCDIRSAPYSRFPHFNRDRLARSLEPAGIQYVFAGDKLGGRIDDPACYIQKRLPDRKINIAELVDYPVLIQRTSFDLGIREIIEMARRARIAVMCSEENPARCHRHLLVARRLTELGIRVLHIRSDGRLEAAGFEPASSPAQASLFTE